MRVGIDIRAINGQRAGIGTYVMGLVSGLGQVDKENNYFLVNDQFCEISNLPENFIVKVFRPGPDYHLQVARFVHGNKLVFHSTFSLIPPTMIGKRSVLTIHDLTALTDPNLHTLKVRSLNKLLFGRAVKRSGQIITPTHVIKDQLLSREPGVKDKTTVVYEAVEDDFGQNISREVLKKYDLKEGYYLFNGTLEPRKNVELLIKAYSKLNTSKDLVLMGKKGWGISHLLSTIKDLGLEDKIRLLDWVPENDLASIYQFACSLIYPSLQEGFGLSPLKAFKVGVPVIVSNIPVFKEVLASGALYTDPHSVDNLAQLMESVTKKEVSQKLIQEGFDQLRKYSWQKTALETKKIYEVLNIEVN